ncbi:adenylate kinase [Methanolobus vulcani]|jgi:adenylate kinase|uniref:Putative adenylate kinase n=1 Tax=Methanolobus vulcani TaxID=38026 RepID=A0A7Z7AYH7_9EURY|nr:adenylate kinase family protein [Methanolobus vulcani]MDK2947859.1 adenylate kinase [Methanolobus sp.]SDF48688.1 adenylate kinase [Methanolobus vulcani]
MLIGITGTPGTGKTSVTRLLEEDPYYQVIHLNELIKEEKLYSEIDTERDCVVADMDQVYDRVLELQDRSYTATIVDSHLSHHIADIVIVLRTDPAVLKGRLEKRNYSEEKVKENLEAEALDIILAEAVEWCEKVFEINTTEESAEKTLKNIRQIIGGLRNGDTEELEEEFRPGSADWCDYLFD